MTEQKCVRTYDHTNGLNSTTHCCTELNSRLERGWKVVFVTSRANYTEYIIEREVYNSRTE